MRITAVVLSALFALASALPAQDAAAQPEIAFQSTELAPGLYAIAAVGGVAGGTIGLLVGDDGVVLIDDSYPPFTAEILLAVAEITEDPIDLVINTHLHGDHVAGNIALGEAGATILAHDAVRRRLVEQGMPTGPDTVMELPPSALPVLTFADAVTVHLNGDEAFVRHLPRAHTDGDSVIHFRGADVVHCGDLFFNGVFPFIDLDNGGSLDGYIAAQEAILELAGPDTRFIAGHGAAVGTRFDLEASVAMLKDARARVGALIDEGKTADEAVAADPLAAYADQSWGFIPTERMVRQVYRSLTEP